CARASENRAWFRHRHHIFIQNPGRAHRRALRHARISHGRHAQHVGRADAHHSISEYHVRSVHAHAHQWSCTYESDGCADVC
ncbi:hypothetical protein PMAYCL1PPCAC_25764, partial [Pristionchus mayeri]